MRSSQTTNPAPDSASNPTTLPEPNPPETPAETTGTTAPPLGVRTPSASQTPSPTTQTPPWDGDSNADPVDSGSIPSSEPTPPASAVKLDKNSLVEILRGAVLTASLALHNVLARTEFEKAASVWVADESDQAQIGDPLAAIAQRRGAAAGVVSTDSAALIEAGLGLLAYGVKNIKKVLAARRQAKSYSGPTNSATGDPA